MGAVQHQSLSLSQSQNFFPNDLCAQPETKNPRSLDSSSPRRRYLESNRVLTPKFSSRSCVSGVKSVFNTFMLLNTMFHKPIPYHTLRFGSGSQGSSAEQNHGPSFCRRNPETQEAITPQYAEWVSLFLWGRDLRLLVPKFCWINAPRTHGSDVTKVLAVSRNKEGPVLLTQTIVLNLLVCLISKGSLCLQIGPSTFLGLWVTLAGATGKVGHGVTPHVSSPPRAPTEGHLSSAWSGWETQCSGKRLRAAVLARRDLRTVSEMCIYYFFFLKKMKSTKGRGWFKMLLR